VVVGRQLGMLGGCLITLLAAVGSSWASDFSVTPVHVFLSASDRSETLTLRNEGEESVRFQVSAFSWDQKPDGSLVLAPTDDVIFFPELLSLSPGQERKVRVGLAGVPGASEKTYRLIIEELAPLQKASLQTKPEVRLLTKMGVPIFFAPPNPIVQGRIEGSNIANGLFSFAVANHGNVHLALQSVRVIGMGASSQRVFGREAAGWYVLSGERRDYQLEISKEDCMRVRSLEVEAEGPDGLFTDRLELPSGSCGSPNPTGLSAAAGSNHFLP